MKKLLIVILFLFLLCSCGKEEKMIGISRINESVICEEYCSLELKVISTSALNDIKLESLNVDINYDYQVQESKKEVKLTDSIDKKIYSYDLSIKVYDPVKITNVFLVIDKETYNFNIGSFMCLSKKIEDVNHIKCFSSFTNDLTKGYTNHKLNIFNKTDKTIMITDVSLASSDENIIVCKNFKSKIIRNQDNMEIAHCYMNIVDDLYKASYVLKIEYIYDGNFYETYYHVNDTGYSETVSNIGTSLLVEKSCFV